MNARAKALAAVTACLRADPASRSRAFSSIADDDWLPVLAIANDHLITPILGRLMRGHRAAVPDQVWSYIEHLYLANCRRNRAIRRQANELIHRFNEAGIVPLLLKGVLMTMFERGLGVGTRMMADIDVVVPAHSRLAAIGALERLGYKARHFFPAGHHAVGEFVRDGDPAAVDLHIELIDQNYILSAAEIWTWSEPAQTADGGRYVVPSPTHRIFHNLLHAQVHHRGGFYLGEIDLRQLFEFAYLSRVYAGKIDWSMIETRLCRYRLCVVLRSYVIHAERFMGLTSPIGRIYGLKARLHAWRCRMQFGHPRLSILARPWANVRTAFAWHRMVALYGRGGGGAFLWRYRHILHVLGSMPRSAIVQKLRGS